MSTVLATAPSIESVPYEPPLWPISVDLYSRMIATGLLSEHEQVYLWKGRLAPLMPIGRTHSAVVRKANDALFARLPEGFDVDREQPVALRREPSVPQPDLVVIRGKVIERLGALLGSEEVLLLVEVADTSLNADRQVAASYAAERIPTYWIINIPEACIEAHTEPIDTGYARRIVYRPDDEIPLVLDGREVTRIGVNNLLP